MRFSKSMVAILCCVCGLTFSSTALMAEHHRTTGEKVDHGIHKTKKKFKQAKHTIKKKYKHAKHRLKERRHRERHRH